MTNSLAEWEPKKNGLFLKFGDGDKVKIRVLTLDPIVSVDKWGGTKYSFIVWNYDENKAQILSQGSGALNRFASIERDDDFDSVNKVDIKISATGDNLERRYTWDVLPKAQELTKEQLKEASRINLEEKIQDHKGRLSEYSEDEESEETKDSGYTAAKKAREVLEVNDTDDEPINLDDIPF